ncbi:hypothetical protein A2686_04235 [Candidatus Woesebacteria bacterium RIFCSPHIGHO2_01_FULL_38_10]|uniref:HEPN domain-containing protein n=1 Tax=Candidatus Woesebacteria bacterium RIFCSPLOWO2_01_FULL_39_10b TaxID=1802517 RepID=A0A1F8BAD1_9BACT|nr:MAG: hypothetical protein A2686_04235 [Candidatus Woesebacteria bacterium RIFCSPHIGHO2_01_FULL_38_10]OGM60318.1 MAG: hypothetical protein A2892_03155 [Candidatus Woesebacteria bacterium RIFCSPLOWO2_01_FULL_39_10b]
MTLNKYDSTSDAIADLYRAAFYLARQSKKVGISFLIKAKDKLGDKVSLDIDKISKGNVFKKPCDYSYWAEKILDEYKRLKFGL